MIENNNRELEIIFVKDQKQFILAFSKKQKCDYLLNVNKIIRDKFDQDIVVPNKIQSFLINYEIKKLIDKAVNVRNRKYNRIIYVNSSLNPSTINNTIKFLGAAYATIKFAPTAVDLDSELGKTIGINLIKKGL